MCNNFLTNLLKTFSKVFLLSMLLFSVVSLTLYKLTSFDLWLHLKTGQLVWETFTFPKNDPFSHTVTGVKWIAHEWLFGAIFYPLYNLALGYGLVIIKVIIIIAVSYFVLFSNDHITRNIWLTTPLLFIAIILSRFRLMFRPHLFSLLFLACYYFAYRRWRKKSKWWGLMFPLLMICWSNIHAGNIFGLTFLVIMFVGEIILYYVPWGDEAPLERRQLTELAAILLVTLIK